MEKLKGFLCALLFVLSFWPAEQRRSRGQSAGHDPRLEAKVDAYLKPYLDLGGFSGSILIARGGRVLLSKGYGMANYELSVPNTSQNKFHLGSGSKTFTAAAILMLQEK